MRRESRTPSLGSRRPTASRAAPTPSRWSAVLWTKTTPSRSRPGTPTTATGSPTASASTSTAERYTGRSRDGWSTTSSIGPRAPRGPYGRTGGWWRARQFPGRYDHDITMFNWPGNDYRDMPLVDQEPEDLARALQDAKRVSLGFARWLQTEGADARNLLLRPDLMGSPDGLAKYPYIRECRRIKAVTTIVEQDVAVAHQPGPRAAHFGDSVGVGWYPIDIHQAGEGDVGTSTRTKPFQIPLGALIPVEIENLIAANKNIRNHPHHQRLLQAPPGRVERRRGCRTPGLLLHGPPPFTQERARRQRAAPLLSAGGGV